MLSLEQRISFLYYRMLSNVLNILVLRLYIYALPCPMLYGWNLFVSSVS